MVKLTRREALLGAGGVVGGVVVGAVAGSSAALGISATNRDDPPPRPGRTAVTATGRTQAGVARPSTPQGHGLVAVFDLPGESLGWLAALGDRIVSLTSGDAAEVLPDGPGDLTVNIGLGPRLIAAADPGLTGAEELPSFAGDDAIATENRGGDVLIAICASDASILSPVLADLAAKLPTATQRWSQRGFRASGEGFVARNPLGFLDGIAVPRSEGELDANVWIGDGPLAGGTVCVIRRLRLDTAGFGGLERTEREAVIGRHASDGSPLSGGSTMDDIDLRAKTATGDYVIPAHSHARAAHPSFTGSDLMLRRGYAYDNGSGDAGLLFICFQRSLRTFVSTQQRLDEVDALMAFATPTASATFLVLPGMQQGADLGRSLVDAQ